MPTVIDFETDKIVDGSGVSPRPVGVSIHPLGGTGRYYGFRHPTGNNCTEGEAKAALARVWDDELIFHHAKFDIGVACEWWDFDWPDFRKIHDTQILAYLDNPIAKSLGLKPLGESLLGLPPEERDVVRDWILEHKAKLKADYPGYVDKIGLNTWGAYIGLAPGDIVGPYAIGDTHRTGLLFQHLYPSVVSRGMLGAYLREIRLERWCYDAGHGGVRVDRKRLQSDYEKYGIILLEQEKIIKSFLGDAPIDTPAELAAALKAVGADLPLTPTGRTSTAAAALLGAVSDPSLARALRYRATLRTLRGTFYENWINLSAKDGYLHPTWHQTRGATGYGTRTGRLSCSDPNLTNVPTEFGEKEDDPLHGLDIPFMRQYLLPDEGKVFVAADYNGQEMRGLAHFAEGKAQEIYVNDPKADFHVVASKLVYDVSGLLLTRKKAKITGFSLIYGAGTKALAQQLGVPYEEAAVIKEAYLNAIPGLREFQNSFKRRQQVRTWGGRIIPVEPPTMYNGAYWSFNYKLCNYLIQGSAADQTKEAAVTYDDQRVEGDLLILVHDEAVIQVPEEHIHTEVPILLNAMEKQAGWDVPFVAEVEWGYNWHELRKYDASVNVV